MSSSTAQQHNPFAAPDADPHNTPQRFDPRSPGADNIHMFERQSVWLLVLLTIITLGIYIPFWYHRQAKLTDSVLNDKVGDGWIYACYAIFIGAVVWLVPEIIWEEIPELAQVSTALDRIGNLVALLLAFKTRNRIHQVINVAEGSREWFSGLATFFLSIFYLQWKINKLQGEPRRGM